MPIIQDIPYAVAIESISFGKKGRDVVMAAEMGFVFAIILSQKIPTVWHSISPTQEKRTFFKWLLFFVHIAARGIKPNI